MVEIIGENIQNFCKGQVIVFNNLDEHQPSRAKRSTHRKQSRGQTQTQFIGFGSHNSSQDTKHGLAEAVSQPDLSRATVSK